MDGKTKKNNKEDIPESIAPSSRRLTAQHLGGGGARRSHDERRGSYDERISSHDDIRVQFEEMRERNRQQRNQLQVI